jgi:site-specific recombinase XerD
MRLAAGPVREDNALVFPSSRGAPLREPHVRAAWRAMLKRAGLPEETGMHDVRHTFATIMLDNGEDLVAARRSLGHSRVNVTADLYVGRVPTAQMKAVERSGELLGTRAK